MRRSSYRRAFTLVELLVVIGVIALLISLLLPALARAREQANQIKCLSNLRQLGMSFIMYANENSGSYPFHADGNAQYPEDWLYWQKARDLRQSAIFRYINSADPSVFRCPSDDPDRRLRTIWEPYVYTFSFNYLFASNAVAPKLIRIHSVRNAAEKFILVDEDERSLDDGNFHPLLVGQPNENFLAGRHDHRSVVGGDDSEVRGNAAFADGHAGYMTRRESRDPRHYDPTR